MMNMEQREGQIWLDGRLVEWADAQVHMLSFTLQHGMGVFEGVRSYPTKSGPAVFRLECHTNRLFRSAKMLGMDIPFTCEQINSAHLELLKDSQLDSAYFRPLVYYGGEHVGVSAKGNSVHVAIAHWPWETYSKADAVEQGIRLKTSSYCRISPRSSMGKAKACGNYMNSAMANREAKLAGYDDALMLDERGCVAEASTSNLFMLRDGKLYTPNRTYILEGITRDTLIWVARRSGIEVIERDITREELLVAEEIFLCGTAIEVVPVTNIDGQAIADGKPGPVFKDIRAQFDKISRGDDDSVPSEWLSYSE